MKGEKVALITGSRRGIGLSIAQTLGENGYNIILSATVDACEVEPVLTNLRNCGLVCDYYKCDISNSEDRKSIFEYILSLHGRLDVLVNNAGVAPLERMDILNTTEQNYQRVMDINLKGTFFMCQKAANIMIEKLGILDCYAPKIINISSISAYTSSTTRGEYCISKSGVSMVTKLFADRLAEYGIYVFEVRPGIILTDMTIASRHKYEEMINNSLTPIKRFGEPKDVANCVLALCSGLLDFSTGQVLNADGGFHLRRL